MDETIINQLEAILNVASTDYVKAQDFGDSLVIIIEELKKVSDKSDIAVEGLTSHLQDIVDQTKESIRNERNLTLTGQMDIKETIAALKSDLLKTFDKSLTEIRKEIPVFEQTDLSGIESDIIEVKSKLSKIKDETPEQTRDKLEKLKGDERLDRKAIKGLEDLQTKSDQQKLIDDLWQRTQFLINRGGSSVVIHDDTLTGDGTQSSPLSVVGGSGSIFIDQTPLGDSYGFLSGVVDGVNTTFVVSEGAYTSGTLEVTFDGLSETQGAPYDFVETDPTTGIFDFTIAPPIGSRIKAIYGKSAGSGTVTTVFETNGTLNGSQSLVNLVEGTNITIVDDGLGNITFNSAAGAQDLQSVTDVGNTTTNDIITTGQLFTGDASSDYGRLNLYDVSAAAFGSIGFEGGSVGGIKTYDSSGNSVVLNSSQLSFQPVGGIVTVLSNTSTSSQNVALPDASGTLALSVNGNTADSAGNITLSGSAFDLQTVTDNGNTTTNDIFANRFITPAGAELSDDGTVYVNGELIFRSYGDPFPNIYGRLREDITVAVGDDLSWKLPAASGTLVLSVNGNTADSAGNITLTAFQDLQSVTDVGAYTNNDVTINGSLYVGDQGGNPYRQYFWDNPDAIFDELYADGATLIFNAFPSGGDTTTSIGYNGWKFSQGAKDSTIDFANITATRVASLPNASGTLALSVNGNTADSAGNITISTGSGTVTSVSGTTNRITITGTPSVNPTVDIAATYVGQTSITTLGTIGTGTWQGGVITGQYGGTGVANTGKTITLGGNLTTTGAFATTLTSTATTTLTLPTTGTLATLAGTEALTNKSVNGVTLTTGGTTTTFLNGVGAYTTPVGAISSVSNSDGTLTISPTIGAVVASLALGHANLWTGVQTFSSQATTQAPVSGSTSQFVGLDGAPLRITFDTHNNASSSGTALMGRRSRGTAGTPSAVQSADTIFSINGRGYGTSQYAAGSTGLVSIVATENFTNTANGTAIRIDTTPNGSVTAAESARFASTGLTLGVSGTLAGKLSIAGVTSGTANLIVAAAAGTPDITLPLSTTTLIGNNLGLSGGTTLVGDTASGGNLTLSSTSNATKGKIIFGSASVYDQVNDRFGIGQTTPLAKLHIQRDNIGSTEDDSYGIYLANTQAATVGAQQYSPGMVLVGQGWKTTATAGSQETKLRLSNIPQQGTASPFPRFVIERSSNAGAYSSLFEVGQVPGSSDVVMLFQGTQVFGQGSGVTQFYATGASGMAFYNAGGSVQLAGMTNAGAWSLTPGSFTTAATLNTWSLAQTWNNASGVYTGIKLNVTNTSSTVGSLLMDLQTGGTSRFSVGVGSSPTTGAVTIGTFQHNFAPTSGTATFFDLTLSPTINQTGGANGITRGLYINPTITAAADFRALEVVTGNALFGGSIIMSGAASVVRLKGYTVATLPAGTVGDTCYVTDALAPTFLAVLVGGGAITTTAFYNGTNWVAQ